MRKIEEQMLDAISDGKNWKSGNTRVRHDLWEEETLVYLHSNLIAVIPFHGESIRVMDGGCRSAATKSRLNALLLTSGKGVFQKNFEWFVWDRWTDESVPFDESEVTA